MVKIYARGGLGNQLFQYGAAFNIAKRTNSKIIVDDTILSAGVNKKFFNSVKLELNTFENQIDFVYCKPGPKAILKSRFLASQRLLGDKFPNLLLKFRVFASEHRENFETFDVINKDITINSYCGSRRFFGDYSHEIAKTIFEIKEKSNWLREITKEIEIKKPIALNIRLGDYLKLKHIYGSPDPDYYLRSIEILKKYKEDAEIWLFSDEPEKAHLLLKDYVNFDKVVSIPSDFRPIEYLVALAYCDAIVCANSSFSWWAGFLSTHKNPNAKIIFPRPMFAATNLSEPFNWLPESWFSVGRNIDI